MSLHLEVSPQTEKLFAAAAAERGVDISTLFEQMVSERFASDEKMASGKMITFGMFPELAGLELDDFKIAEFHGDDDDGLDWTP